MQSPASTSNSHELWTTAPSVEKTIHTKVAHSLHSLHSLQSSRSSGGGPKPTVPPKKRQKLDNFMSMKDPYANLGAAFSEPGPSNYIPEYLDKSDTIFEARVRETVEDELEDPFADSATTFDHVGISSCMSDNNTTKAISVTKDKVPEIACSIAPMPSFIEEDCQFESLENFGSKRPPTTARDSDRLEREDRWRDSGSWISLENVSSSIDISQRQRNIDSSRRIETFSDDELQDLKLAANFLGSLTFCKEAFPLYVLILKHLKQEPVKKSDVVLAAFLDCVVTATTAPQIEIAQSLLRQALNGEMGALTNAETFVFRNILANTYKLSKQYDTAISEIKLAWHSIPSIEHLDLLLPQSHRSLDLIFYHQVTRNVRYYNNLLYSEGARDCFDSVDQGLLQQAHLQDQCIRQTPGPFELNNGQMKNPCLRSCLAWCTTELERCTAEMGAWKTLLRKWEEQSRFRSLLEMQRKSINDECIYFLKCVSLYCYLWERCHSLRSRPFDQQDFFWAEHAEQRMGIPASTLLRVMCSSIIYYVQTDYEDSPRRLAFPACSCAKRLSKLLDEALANEFFEVFSGTFNMPVLAETSESSESKKATESSRGSALSSLLSWRGSYLSKDSHDALIEGQNTARVYVVEFIEENLALLLPEARSSITSDTTTPIDKSMESLRIATATLLPTLASSLKSSNFSALCELRDRIQQNAENAMQDATDTAIAARTSIDLPSISDLSQAMASSLNLASVREAPSFVLDVLANVSSTIRDRISISDDSVY